MGREAEATRLAQALTGGDAGSIVARDAESAAWRAPRLEYQPPHPADVGGYRPGGTLARVALAGDG